MAALLAVALLPPAVRSAVYAREGMTDTRTGHWREERAAGLHAARELARLGGGGKALVDSADNLDFLDVLAGSGAPERFVLSHGTDPQAVANGSAWGYPPEDRFGLARGGAGPEAEAALAAEGVRLLLVREPRFVAALDAVGRWERARAFGPWVLYRPRPSADASPSPVADLSGAPR